MKILVIRICEFKEHPFYKLWYRTTFFGNKHLTDRYYQCYTEDSQNNYTKKNTFVNKSYLLKVNGHRLQLNNLIFNY